MTEIAVTAEAPRQRGVIATMAARYDMDPVAFERVLRATVFPAEASKEHFAAFLLVAKEYDFNPLLKQIYAYPDKRGGVQAIVPIDGWLKIINDHPQYDGMEFMDRHDETGKLTAIVCRIYRKDRAHPTEVTEYMNECQRPTDPWKQWPARMLRHKAVVQAARYAFSYSGIVDPDETGRLIEMGEAEIVPAAQTATAKTGEEVLDRMNALRRDLRSKTAEPVIDVPPGNPTE